MKVSNIIENEVLPKDKSMVGAIARSLVQGSAEKLYSEGTRPTIENVRVEAERGANNLLASIMKAVDEELASRSVKQTNRV